MPGWDVQHQVSVVDERLDPVLTVLWERSVVEEFVEESEGLGCEVKHGLEFRQKVLLLDWKLVEMDQASPVRLAILEYLIQSPGTKACRLRYLNQTVSQLFEPEDGRIPTSSRDTGTSGQFFSPSSGLTSSCTECRVYLSSLDWGLLFESLDYTRGWLKGPARAGQT